MDSLITRAKREYAAHGITAPAYRGCPLVYKDTADNNGRTEIIAMATTAAVDLEGEVVLPEGLDPSVFKSYKSIYANHDYLSPEGPIATLRSLKLDKGKGAWVVRMTMCSTPYAKNWATLIEEEAVNGTSIGFERKESGPPTEEEVEQYGDCEMVTRKGSWFELSVTPMPCNPEALIQRGRPELDDGTKGKIDRLVVKGLIPREFAVKVGLEEAARKRVVVLL